MQPLVSVCMITYNHEKYIAQAIESVLMQKADFEYELVIGEDCSMDKTREIVRQYANKYGKQIKILLPTHNLGMIPNLINTISACNGKYIALLEGDDYWIDPYKLQKQVDFLEGNPEYVICFHCVKILENGEFSNNDITEKRYNQIEKYPANIIDLLTIGNFIHTPSVVFRNIIKEYPQEYMFSPVGDYFLYVILAQNGYIKRLDDVMAVYRKGVGGFSSLSNMEMTKKILIYQACILSYLQDKSLKKILLDKHINLITRQFDSNKNMGFKSLLKALLYKLINYNQSIK